MKILMWTTLYILLGLYSIQSVRSNGSPTNIDIGISSTGCASYKVTLKPYEDFQNEIMQIRFAIKWPVNTVQLQNHNSSYGLEQQGPVVTHEGYHYAYFVSEPFNGIWVNWTGGEEYAVLNFEHDQSAEGYIDISVAQDDYTLQNDKQYYLESSGEDVTGSIFHQVNDTYAGTCYQYKDTDIGLFNTSCGNYEVRLRPSDDIQSAFTNLQFTLKWPEGSVGFTGFNSVYNVEKQGPTRTHNGYNYAVFAVVPSQWIQIDWEGNQEYTVLSFTHDETGNGNIDVEIAGDEWAIQNNGLFYFEVMGLEYSRGIYHESMNTYTGSCSSRPVQVILQGPYDSDIKEMTTHLNDNGSLPYFQPYDQAPWNYSGGEYVTAIPDSVVDWVLIELRDSQNPATLVQRKACFLSKSGRVLDEDFSKDITFSVASGNYYLVIDHRNHLPVMSGNAIAIPYSQAYDFTEVTTTQPYLHENPLPTVIELENTGEGVYGMIAGDTNADGVLKYLGLNDDRGNVLSYIQNKTNSSSINQSFEGYSMVDVNMNNVTLYLGIGDDRGIILNNIQSLKGTSQINQIYEGVVPDGENE